MITFMKLWINWGLAIGLQNFPVLAVNESCTRLVISTKKSNDTYAVEEYDFNSGVLVRSIDCHSGWITCLQFLNDNHVVTGSQGTTKLTLHTADLVLWSDNGTIWNTDHSLKLWNLDSGECVKQFAGHTAAVTCLQVLKRQTTANAPIRLVSGSQDGSIKIWVCTLFLFFFFFFFFLPRILRVVSDFNKLGQQTQP